MYQNRPRGANQRRILGVGLSGLGRGERWTVEPWSLIRLGVIVYRSRGIARLEVGDTVSHQTWGSGRVLETSDTVAGDVLVQFRDEPAPRRLSGELARRVLTRLPPDGLRALLLDDPERITGWTENAPLKLAAAALTDIGHAAKPSDIRAGLASAGLLKGGWDAWWKRVQPAMKECEHFHLRSDGSYELNTPVEDIAESPLPPPHRRPKARRLGNAELDKTVRELGAGGLRLDAIAGADNKRLAARELIREGLDSPAAREATLGAVTGSVATARAVFDELLRSGRNEETVEALARLSRSCVDLLSRLSDETERRAGEQIPPRARLIRDTLAQMSGAGQRLSENGLRRLSTEVLSLAGTIPGHAGSGWASESLQALCETLAALTSEYPDTAKVVGESLTQLQQGQLAALDVIGRFLGMVPSQTRTEAMQQLLFSVLSATTELVDATLRRLLSQGYRLHLLGSLAELVLGPSRSHPAMNLLRALSSPEGDLTTDDRRTRLRLALAAGVVGPRAEMAVAEVLSEDLTVLLEEGALGGAASPVLASLGQVLGVAIDSERQQFSRERSDLQSEIARLWRANEESAEEQSRLRSLARRLQDGYRLPEDWSKFQGKQEVVRDLATLYQETFRSHAEGGVPPAVAEWLLSRIESLLHGHGAVRFGEVNTEVAYDPTLHEFVIGSTGASGHVRVECPGFRWHDPAGNIAVIARAKVA